MVKEPKILGFLCHWCCYAAADAAGLSRFQYPPYIRVIRVMCTGRIDPVFILDGFLNGADGIFVAGCHLGECHYRSGNYEAIKRIKLINTILEHLQIDTGRTMLEWVSAAEAPRFVRVITEFTDRIRKLGLMGQSEGLDRQVLMHKLKAAKMATEKMKLRVAFAKQAKQMKEEGIYDQFPSEEKLKAVLVDEMTIYETLLYLQEKERPVAELAGLLDIPPDRVTSCIESLRKRKMWNGTSQGASLVT